MSKKNSGSKQKSQLAILAIILVSVSISSFLIFNWLINFFFEINNAYISALYTVQFTLLILLLIFVPIIIHMARQKEKQVQLLTDAIQKVASGDYDANIKVTDNSEFASIYEDFNKMCEELKSVRVLRNDFLNNYSHEFKTPIASINGFASLLLDENLPKSQQKEYLQIIVDESARLSKMAVNTILLSKLNSQQIITDVEKYDLSEQLRQCSILLSQKWLDKKISFNGDFKTAMFYGNKESLQHLWINLIDNAIKYTPIGGEIIVKDYLEDESVVVEVSDTGEGMDEKTMNKLFDPYYQADTSHVKQGLGLGLTIVNKLVNIYNGTISVKSELGVGSKFIVRLPIRSTESKKS